MYPHEQDESKKKYLIVAVIFHLLLFFGIFLFKGFNTEAEVEVNNDIPPESSTLDNAVVSDENLQDLEEKKKEVETLQKDSMKANAIDASKVEEAIQNHNNEIAETAAKAERERLDKIRKAEEVKERKRQDEIALKKKIEDEKQEKIKQEKAAKEAKEEAVRKEKQKEEDRKKLEEKQKAQEEKEKLERIEKAKAAEEERKRKSAEAIKKAEAERQSLLKKKALEAKRLSNQNRGYDSSQKSLSNDQKLAYLRAYRDDIYNKVYSNWLRPGYSKRGWECVAHITQTPTGKVTNVKIVSCQGDTEFQNSVKKAIYKSSPLPLPKHDSLFNETVEIKFKVT